jgi:hypothetical protein
MKTKLLLLIVALFSFAASCEPEEVQQEPQGCDCRKMYYTQQTVNYGIQFVYTHRGEWEVVDCSIKESGTLQMNGFIWTGFTPIDDTHNYRWECKNE